MSSKNIEISGLVKLTNKDMQVERHYNGGTTKTIQSAFPHPSLRTPSPTKSEGKRIAFTLAEVLITIGIIGVVAAITIPNLIHNYQVSVWENSLKKDYNLLVNAFRMVLADTDCSDLMCTGMFPEDRSDTAKFNENMKLFVSKHLSGASYCEIGDTEKCPGYEIAELKGNQKYTQFSAANQFVIQLNNGALLFIVNRGCVDTPYQANSKLKNHCANIVIDTNGKAKPNTFGKDVFQLVSLNSDGFIYPDTSLEWAKAQNGTGTDYANYWRNNVIQCGTPGKLLKEETTNIITGSNCLARIMENGWKMDYLRK